jgi:GlpG protein
MRQVGTLSTERSAQQFAAWLVAHQMPAHAEAENGAWVVWIRDEDHLPRAREALVHYQANPADPQYQDAERAAQQLAKDEEAKRRQAQKNVVEMRGRWGNAAPGMAGGSRRAPLVFAMIAFSVFVAIFAWDDTVGDKKQPVPGSLYRGLVFVDPVVLANAPFNNFQDIARGQVWRLVTPIFIHYSLAHLVLNMLWLHSFGSPIEDRRGSLFLLLLVLALAVSSNVGQAVEISFRSGAALFGGMSGVGYGLFGYMAVKAKFDPRERYFLAPGTTFIAMLWFLLCILRDIPPFSNLLADMIPAIANTAHAVGLLLGAAIAYTPLLLRKGA